MNEEKALELFKKYAWKYLNRSYRAGEEMTNLAWYSKYWGDDELMNRYPGNPRKRDWYNDEIKEAFDWWLVEVAGINLETGERSDKEQWSYQRKKEFEQKITDYVKEKESARRQRQYESQRRREEEKEKQGLEFKKQMRVGDVWMVKGARGNFYNGERGIQVMEVESDSFSGFYLDFT
jgi:hypothetical protein